MSADPVTVFAGSPDEVPVEAGEHTVVRTIDAADCLTTPTFLRSIAAALEFPEGSVNWNVVEERLYDLTWFPDADEFVLVLLNCERFIGAPSAHDLPILDDIFQALAEESAGARRRVLLQCPADQADEFAALLARPGPATS